MVKKAIICLFLLLLMLVSGVDSYVLAGEDITLEEAERILLEYLAKQGEDGVISPVTTHPQVEVIGYTNIMADNSYNEYYVQPGDSLYKIARKYGTTVEELRLMNNLSSNYLYVGMKLLIPLSRMEYTFVYEVKPGDTLYLLARKFGTSINKIKQKNALPHNYLYVGQELLIPMQKPKSRFTYYVKPGDSLYKIAQKYNTTIRAIKIGNNLHSNHLFVGQKLTIPVFNNNADQKRLEGNPEEMELLARAVYSEARGEPYKGQVAIAAVVLNRVFHPLFPDNIRDVIFQPWQFSAVHDGQFWLTPNEKAYEAAHDALNGWDPTNGAIYYYNPKTASSRWVFYRKVVLRIGNHVFAV